ncbi:MAG: 1,4-alpha-glucan branching protein GlgB [Alphaproteobacteria bacterium]|nr:1,4-alpha-glucan branching protein GlgB [Alphaproteobacteria bacterium]MBF0128765.1 1,4-alpha-glucan branching protein GlgB [Alphaproteobacteria bacterium]
MKHQVIDGDVLALVNSDHSDPFSVLGPHQMGPSGGIVIRAFLPHTLRAEVVDYATGDVMAEMVRIHQDGVYVAEFPKTKERFAYRLRLHFWGGGSMDVEDAYRFPPVLGEMDQYLLAEGTHIRSYEKLGAHPAVFEGVKGVSFAVWAPNARRVSVIGDFNDWDGRRNPMRVHHSCGVWEMFIPGATVGSHYKFEIRGPGGNLMPLKADPYAFHAERAPQTASKVYDLSGYQWTDQEWMHTRTDRSTRNAPMSIYEVHLGSWRRNPEQGNRSLTYRELADELVSYVKDLGYTHIEMMPVSEHPFEGSWGYQPIALFAPTCRFGEPNDFRYLVNRCHEAGIGVILDWVAGHFPEDSHGLGFFDGTHLYEHSDPRQGRHGDWGTLIYNYSRSEVANFLLSNALFWMEQYHIDGLRVDAVASMIYLDYSRQAGEWIPNEYGGNENLGALAFLKRTNEMVYAQHSGAFTIAEESTAWPMVSRPTYLGGLGFGFKWNMGWMHDTLRYMSLDPIYRRFHHDDLTFGLLYAFHENFVLAISHDEVVHGKGSLIGRMPGDEWQKFANLRLYFAFMYTQPGKKLLFMGSEFGVSWEWNHDGSLDWSLLQYPVHRGAQAAIRDLNHLYRATPALHEKDCESDGFAWIDCHDHDQSILSYLRRGKNHDDVVIVICNFTPAPREFYRVGVPLPGLYAEVFNSDSEIYGGSNMGNGGAVLADEIPMHGHAWSLSLTLPPLAGVVLRPTQG